MKIDNSHAEFRNFLFVEKYRPQTIEDCILPEALKNIFQEMVTQGSPQNLLLSGGAGCGKTSVAKALCKDLDCDWIMVNCSEDGNIDTLRTRIRNFASTVSLQEGVKKVVILDEFDYSNAQSTQPALRGFIEEFAENCRFILTCNFKNRVIEPLHSRCTPVDFRIPQKEKPQLAVQFLKRAEMVLTDEGIEYDQKVVAQLVSKYFPDFRRTLNELQRYSVNGKIDVGILQTLADVQVKDLIKSMKAKDFSGVRKWVVDNLDNDQTRIFRAIYDSLYDTLESGSIPQAILLLADYQYKGAFATDHEINISACLIQLMMECKFK
jgi:DNA polymerase III delta prime subunit